MAAKRTAEAVNLLRAGDVRGLLSRYSDLALAGLVVAIVGMMIVPLPTPLLDLLISVNIAVSGAAKNRQNPVKTVADTAKMAMPLAGRREPAGTMPAVRTSPPHSGQVSVVRPAVL